MSLNQAAVSRSTTTTHWRLEIAEDGVGWLAIDKADASVNSLSREVMEEFDSIIASLEASPPRALILTSRKPGFIAGADIKGFVGLQSEDAAYQMIRQGQQVIERLRRLNCVTVAAINGFALGGGLEVALACRYRILANDPSITLGFPEVQLGVHPGLGGTVRSVELAGPIGAMELMLSGRSIRPQRALEMGLVDQLAPPEKLLERARKLALDPPRERRMSLHDRLFNASLVRGFMAGKMRSQVARRARREHYPAPYALIDLWQRYGGQGEQAYEAEARSMAKLLCTETSRNLVRVFFLQERLKSGSREAAANIKNVHVVGAGVMGGDIATWCAVRGLNVTLQDREDKYVQPAMERARKFLEKRYPDQAKRDEVMSRLKADVAGSGVADADLVIEAIFENLQAKRELFAKLEPQLKPTALLASNTSSIVLEQLAEGLQRPERLTGLHFFNPVAKMPLVEVIHAAGTAPDYLKAGLAFGRRIDKLAIACRSAPGFLVNRVLMPYLSEAIRAAEEGIPLALIDRAAEDFGMPMGPIELADVVGLDVVMGVGKVFFSSADTTPAILSTRFEAKKFGKKSGEGFYVWQDDKPQKPSPEGSAPADLQDRLMLALVNEAVAVLREGLVEDADLVDAGVIFGAGFAPFRGGPLQYARSRGIDAVIAQLETLKNQHGERFTPDAGWELLR